VIGFAKFEFTEESHMAESVLRTKSKEFAKNIVFLCRKLKQAGVESALINQLLRCGTSVGANVHEAQYAQGTKDFISKFEIALKECNESEYWLELLHDTNSLSDGDFAFFQKNCVELRRMLVSSVTTLKNKQDL
jgi:four helix bundle protein